MTSAPDAFDTVRWITNLKGAPWDRALADLRGHPLQSALWGDARSAIDGIPDSHWAAVGPDGGCIFMARTESRTIRGVGKVAWIPRGPATAANAPMAKVYQEFIDQLRAEGYLLCIDDPYPCRPPDAIPGTQLFPRPRTILIDLTLGKDRLMANLHSQWRAGVRAAARAGVSIGEARDAESVAKFYSMCESTSRNKGFALPGSEALMLALCGKESGPDTEAVLLLASYAGQVAAGALAMRCGRSIHYMWGASDRSFAKHRPGEAVQWAMIEWALQRQCTTYDLEGIVPDANSGVYAFKRRMGGAEVDLPGKQAFALDAWGALSLRVGRWLGRL